LSAWAVYNSTDSVALLEKVPCLPSP